MSVLYCDRWEGVYNREEEINNPIWEIVEKSIALLDQKTRTQIVLQLDDMSYISVGGGNGSYLVYISTPDENFYNLVTDGHIIDSSIKKELITGGQKGYFPSKNIVSKSLTLRAVETFFVTGEKDKELNWENG